MGRFDIFPIFIATFASRRVTLIATHSKSQKQTRLPIRYLYFILPFKPLINKEVIKVFQNYTNFFITTYAVKKIIKEASENFGLQQNSPHPYTFKPTLSSRMSPVCMLLLQPLFGGSGACHHCHGGGKPTPC